MRVEWLPSAVQDLQRLREFIRPHNPEAAQRVAAAIRVAVTAVEANPRIGKPVEDLPHFHDLVIPFGAYGYVLRYRVHGDAIFIMALKHGKEAGFQA